MRPAVVAACGGGLAVQAARHREALRQAAEAAVQALAGSGLGAQGGRGRVDALHVANVAAARGIVAAVLGPGPGSGPAPASGPGPAAASGPAPSASPSASCSGHGALEGLVIAFTEASRQPRPRRDEAEASRLEAALAEALQREVDGRAGEAGQAAVEQGADGAAEFGVEGGAAGQAGPAVTGGGPRPGVPEPTALLPRLLARPELSPLEAQCNAASCLLAGFETSCLLLACALLHLAQRPDLQQALAEGLEGAEQGAGPAAAGKDPAARYPPLLMRVLQETLRVNPPVMGQPRVVVAPGGLTLPPASPGAAPLHLRRGAAFAVDLLSAAHGWSPGGEAPGGRAAEAGVEAGGEDKGSSRGAPAAPERLDAATGRTGDEPALPVVRCSVLEGEPGGGREGRVGCLGVLARLRGGSSGGRRGGGAGSTDAGEASKVPPTGCPRHTPAIGLHPSWHWDPQRPPAAEGCPDPYAAARPFGIGPRACPAGALSLALAREVLWALLRGGYRWRLAQPGRDADWGRRTEGAPTLRLPGPVGLEVERVGAVGGGQA
ncbi:hypothetical protein HYH03_014905 [Edaphochlamys debaryana]|uniref:Cytochrome P450 n=1 Tax=Edaphochlamys debaryana TaxID=47281 RepID=A0A835XPA7_9CHLO|nr:hypothetical protein HYH03_014905 [Edaphochlamys debaryana]|eukprot:KAG2486458.1 hypothetical protein HYH03_014905 [Edaphochlamys debaryana]